ncbi:unnamed protein product [Schistosoma mattheei]|uniref:Uncharacterized protein n=1 Tax=Schistosoma mattheei TaxID=31246 RepID=A0A183NYX6_9TREM|nr:unnamed protein product [Schistosoma mattheei]
MTVLSGNTGVGKTTFMCEYSLDLAEQGVPTLWGSFEMPLRKTMEVGVKDSGVEHIVIDNLQFLLGAGDGAFVERFQRQDHYVQKLRAFATEKGTHEETGRLLSINSLYGGGKISQEADNIMFLQVDSSTSIPKKYLQVGFCLHFTSYYFFFVDITTKMM